MLSDERAKYYADNLNEFFQGFPSVKDFQPTIKSYGDLNIVEDMGKRQYKLVLKENVPPAFRVWDVWSYEHVVADAMTESCQDGSYTLEFEDVENGKMIYVSSRDIGVIFEV